MVEYIINNFLIIYLLELGAAVTGSYYLKKNVNPRPEERILVMYLWLVVFVEIVGLYPVINYYTEFEAFPFVAGTLFERNYWWYNSYALIKYPVFFYFFIMKSNSLVKRKIFSILAIFFILSGILNLFFSNVFFTAYSIYTSIVGTFILVILIFLYYYETLNSNRILDFYTLPAFYFSMGILLWHLIVTPIFIYSQYFTQRSPEFVELHYLILLFSNIILYSLFILGWLIGKKYNSVKGDLVRA